MKILPYIGPAIAIGTIIACSILIKDRRKLTSAILTTVFALILLLQGWGSELIGLTAIIYFISMLWINFKDYEKQSQMENELDTIKNTLNALATKAGIDISEFEHNEPVDKKVPKRKALKTKHPKYEEDNIDQSELSDNKFNFSKDK